MPATARKRRKAAKLTRTHMPEGMELSDWQIGLRRQFAGEQAMKLRNLGDHPVFSEFSVTNPATRRTYRVAIRGGDLGVNFCSCPDFAVNTLGTCKHIEFTLRRLRAGHGRALRQPYRPAFSEVFLRYGPQRTVMFSAGAECPAELAKLTQRHFAVDGQWRTPSFARFNDFVQEARRIDPELRVYDDALALVTQARDAEARRHHLGGRYRTNGAAMHWKKLLKVSLYPYQQQGALFAAEAGRSIIADEMGLGKTIQAIAAAEILAREYRIERALIVCPASLKYQWKHEIAQFSERDATVVEGLTHQRRALYAQPGFFKIVNYDVVHRDLESIAAWGPDLVILDEAQRIKNWQTRTAQTVKRIESPYTIVLTGTPLENRIEELHSIVEFVDRHRLGPLFAFKAAHEQVDAESTKVIGYRDLNKITRTLAPILIRRTKAEVLKQLPPRMDKNFFVPMTEAQWEPHNDNRDIVAKLVKKWRTYKFLTEADQLRLRIALQRMRMSCDSTYLIDHQTKHGTKVDELCRLLSEIFEDRAAKVVIFSQWVRMNELVIEMLEDRKWGHVHLHGGVPSRERSGLTQALREEPDCRVFLSTDAGGVGLNLQAASTVINMDLPWNPAVLEQRIGRAHRMGQKNPVRVVNFVSEGTIEHGMLSLLKFKKSVFAGVLDGASDEVFMGDSALNRFMKTVETATESSPIVVPTPTESEDVAEAVGAAMVEAAAPGAADRTAAAIDAQSLGELLSQGAQLLQAFGQALTQPKAVTTGKLALPGGMRVASDPATGRPEVRFTLPDQQVLHAWVGQLRNVFSGLLCPGTGG